MNMAQDNLNAFSAHIKEEYDEQIEELADNLEISKNKALNMILSTGLSNWEAEIRIAQLESKIDLIIESFAEEENAKERMKEAMEEFHEKKSLDGSTKSVNEPTEAMQSIGITPDEWEG
jgi:hypothetical protein